MLQDAVAAFLDGLKDERALDEPLMALLRARGFTHVNRTHGSVEFGKDIVARHGGKQFAFQLKLGDVAQAGWTNMRGQLDLLRLSDYGGPEFDLKLPRQPVLVISGRLKGNPSLLAAEYNRQARERGEPEVEIWPRDELISLFAGNPDAVLRGSIDGALLRMLGSVERDLVDMDFVEAFSRRWDEAPAGDGAGLSVIEATLVADSLARNNRVDLACHLAASFVRSAWANQEARTQPAAPTVAAADAGAQLFEMHARALWLHCRTYKGLLSKRGLVGFSRASAWVTYPIRCMRVIELLGLLGLRLRDRGDAEADDIAAWVARFSAAQPGCARPVSDRYAVSIIPAVLLLRPRHRAAAQSLLRRTTIWLCDRYERGELGLEAAGGTPEAELDRLLGGAFESVRVRGPRRISTTAAVLLDLAAICGFARLYGDIRNDQLAVGVTPAVLRTPDTLDQYALLGAGNRWQLNPSYPDALPRGGRLKLAHYSDVDRDMLRLDRPWDLLAVAAALRDRHFVGAMRTYV